MALFAVLWFSAVSREVYSLWSSDYGHGM